MGFVLRGVWKGGGGDLGWLACIYPSRGLGFALAACGDSSNAVTGHINAGWLQAKAKCNPCGRRSLGRGFCRWGQGCVSSNTCKNSRLNEESAEVLEETQVLESCLVYVVLLVIFICRWQHSWASVDDHNWSCGRDIVTEQTPKVFVVKARCHSSWGASY